MSTQTNVPPTPGGAGGCLRRLTNGALGLACSAAAVFALGALADLMAVIR